MRNLLGATALAVVMASAAAAQTAAPAPAPSPAQAAPEAPAARETGASLTAWLAGAEAGDIHASEMIGATLHAADDGEATAGRREDWEDAGVVSDILLTRDGAVRAVLVDVGTFLGMGGKTVAAPLGAIRFIAEDGDDADDYDLVIMADRETLQGAPAYERPSVRAEVSDMTTMTPANHAAVMPFAHEGYARADHHAMTAKDLEKATVYGRGDDKIGSISDLVVSKGGGVTDAIVDVGGFLGMGAHSVSMPFADFTVLRQSDGDQVRVYLDTTKEKLKAMPRHGG